MKCQLLLAGRLPVPLGPREMETPPQVGETLVVTVGDRKRRIKVVAVAHLPVVEGGTSAPDEAWIICRLP